jgi:hypothetical protein
MQSRSSKYLMVADGSSILHVSGAGPRGVLLCMLLVDIVSMV